jgi:lactate dehydrogenase-like 2-hydroxyacid dehydrogenase
MAGYSRDSLIEIGMICVRAIVDVVNGRRPKTVINPEVFK